MNQQERAYLPRRPTRGSVAAAEEKAWLTFYRHIGDPTVAAEVVKFFSADQELKRRCPALFIRATQTLSKDAARKARAERVGQFVRGLFGRTASGVSQSFSHGRDVALACLPPVGEPAATRAAVVAQEPQFVDSRRAFSRAASEGGGKEI